MRLVAWGFADVASYAIRDCNILPEYAAVHQMDVAAVSAAMWRHWAAAADRWGRRQRRSNSQQMQHGSPGADDVDAIRTSIDTLREKIGQRNVLFRQALDSTEDMQWAYARVVSVPITRQIDQWSSQPLTIGFEQWSNWHGDQHGAWLLDSGETFDSGLYFDGTDDSETLSASPGTVTLTNAGNVPVYDAIVTVTAGSAAIRTRYQSAMLMFTGHTQARLRRAMHWSLMPAHGASK